MTCTVHVSCDQQLNSLQWRNSTGHTLNTTTGGLVSALQLHFQPLRESDSGQYTCVALGPVSYVSVKRVNSSTLDVSWGPAQPVNGVISHYLVWVNSSSQHHRASVPAPAQSVLVGQLNSGVPYMVYVAAVNSAGEAEWRATKYLFTDELSPSAPGNLTVSVLDSSHVRVEWSLLSPDEARGHILSYTVTYSGATKTSNITTSPIQNSVVINDKIIGTYSILLWATNSAGAGKKSALTLHFSESVRTSVVVDGAVAVAVVVAVATIVGVASVAVLLLVLKIKKKSSHTSGTIGVNATVSTSSNLAYGVVSHDTQGADQGHQYELVATNRSQPRHKSTARPSSSQKQTSTRAQEATYEPITRPS